MGNPTPPDILKRDLLNMTTFTSEDLKNALINSKLVEDAPYHPGYEDAVIGVNEAGRPLSVVIRERMIKDNKRFWAGDNISAYVNEADKQQLINEATQAFEKVLDTLLIDRTFDPNSHGTAKRLAKMYFDEIMAGRYEPAPDCTAFPNDSTDRYEGMLVVRSELRSMCSHHHQPVTGVAYIGIIAANKLIGLSKYTRIAQWCARRGTLQEELCNDIAKEIMKATDSNDVGVYIQAIHGCCENRGIMAHSSLTQTTVLKGAFTNDPGTKKEFMDNIKLQQDFAPR
jgi:GTP cyclohydrolase I